MNITSDQTYQLSLYIQNDPTLEQKTDSKVTIQCSSQVTKNIVVEQNFATTDYSRRVDSSPGVGKNRTIVPTVNLTVDTESVLNQTVPMLPTARIDILRGRVPFVKLIDSRVELGDDLTVIIRAKAKPGKQAHTQTDIYSYSLHFFHQMAFSGRYHSAMLTRGTIH